MFVDTTQTNSTNLFYIDRNFDGPIHFRNGTVSPRLTFDPSEDNLMLVRRPRNAGLTGFAIAIR